MFDSLGAPDIEAAPVPYRTFRPPLCGKEALVDAKKEDRRIQKTRKLLTEALLALVQEKGFEDLTVQDILDRANVGRSTFYTHFQGKEDLLLQGLDHLQGAMRDLQQQSRKTTGEAFGFRHFLFAHVQEQRGVFRAMIGRHSGLMIQRRFQQMLLELVREDLKVLFSGTVPEDLVQFIAGGMYGMMAGWMDGRAKPSPEEMSDRFHRFATALVGGCGP